MSYKFAVEWHNTIFVLLQFPEPCVAFLERQAKNLNLPVAKYYPGGPKYPIVVITWVGQQPTLPSILLNSHMDVVPVFADKWTHPPFAADVDEDDRIIARGAQDMKSVGTQYLGAIRALKRDGFQPKRTVHVVFVPEEEIGGDLGMRLFAPSADFKALNVGFCLDEGISSTTSTYKVFFAERIIWRIKFHCSGNAGHGSLLLPNTAGEKVSYLLQKFSAFRKHELERLESNTALTIGDVTTVNLTMCDGGVQGNVIPPVMTITYDVRLAIDVDLHKFEQQLNLWCTEAGGSIEIEFIHKDPYVTPTATDASNPYFVAFKKAIDELWVRVEIYILT